MSLSASVSTSTATTSRVSKLGVFSTALVAFALAALTGCGEPLVTASTLKAPSPSVGVGLGALRGDGPPPAEARTSPARDREPRSSWGAREPRGVSLDYCRRCSN